MSTEPAVPAVVSEELVPGKGREVATAEGGRAGLANPSLNWAKEALQLDWQLSARRRRVSFLRRLLIFIGLPTLLAAAYVFLYATPRYVSEFQLVYQTADPSGSPPAMLGSAGSSNMLASALGIGSATVDMSRVLASYLTSDDLLRRVDESLHLRTHYSDPRIDRLDRLPAGASQEDFLAYFQKRITVDALMGSYVVVDVEAFDRETAAKAARAMADAADQMVQELSNRALRDMVHQSERELARTQGQLVQATLEVTRFRNQHHNFDPQAMATQLGTVVGGLESQLSGYRAALSSARKFVDEDAPAVKALRAEIAAVEQEIVAENLRLASQPKRDGSNTDTRQEPYSQTVADYVRLTLEQQFATDAYVSAKQALDAARAAAASKQKYVESFVKPNAPQASTSPDPTHVIAGTFVVALVFYMIGSLLLGAFRDEAGV